MKKIKKILVVCLSSILLSGCGETTASSSNISSEDSVSSEVSIETDSPWEKELQKLMIKYCGEVLPYPEGMLTGEITYTETSGTNGETVLKIFDESDSFTLDNYYEKLEEKDWYAVKGYNGEAKRSSNDLPFYELTKGNNGIGYDLSYTFRNAEEASTTTEAVSSGNVIICYNNLTTKLTKNVKWDENNVAAMNSAITTTVPFIALGENYVTHWSSTNEDVLLIYDYSIHDLREQYIALLEEDGFYLSPVLSKSYNFHILYKDLPDGSKISAGLSYTNGNYFQFAYSAKPQKTASWPTSILKDIQKVSGITIPEFYSSDISQYYSYEKNGKVYIYAETQTNFEYDTDYYKRLNNAGLIDDGWGNFQDWEETVSLKALTLYNQEGNLYIQYGFQIIVELTDPTSSFAEEWPIEALSSYLSNANIDVSCPVPSLTNDKKMKYGISSEEDENSFDVSIHDPNSKHYSELKTFFYNQAFFEGVNEAKETYFEDASGKLRITLERDGIITKARISSGEKKAHQQIFSFTKNEISLGLGASEKLNLDIQMLPYKVTYSSSDTTGKVTVDENGVVSIAEDATAGDTVTITACMNVPGEEEPRRTTCTINVLSRTPYTAKTAMDVIAKLLNAYRNYPEGSSDALSTCYSSSGKYYYVLTNFLGGSENLEILQNAVKNNLLLDDFVLKTDWKEGTSVYGNPEYKCTYTGDGLTIEYIITLNDGITMFEIRAR